MGRQIQRRLGLLRLSATGPARRAARYRGVLAGTVLALVSTSPSLQVAGPVDVAAPVAAPLPQPGPARAGLGPTDGALTVITPPLSAQPVVFQPVAVQKHRIQVEGASPNALVEARTVEGVAFATAVRMGEIVVGAPASAPTAVRIAAVDPAEFRVLTAQPIADAVTLWENVAGGDVAFTHEVASKLSAQLGQPVTMGAGGPVRVGAIATNTTPPVADAIVAPATGERLGLAHLPQTILVAVHEGTPAEEVARRLEQRLHAKANVIPDPRAPRPVPPGARITADNVWDLLAMCESSGNWHINTGNGYYGGLQFLPESWYMVGGRGLPHEASREEQIYRAKLLLAIQGWKAWPACSLKLGLRKPDPGERVSAASTSRPGPAPRPAAGGGGNSTRAGTTAPASQPTPEPKPTTSERKKTKLPLLSPLSD